MRTVYLLTLLTQDSIIAEFDQVAPDIKVVTSFDLG
jgi:hypothetical protein